MGKVTVAGVLDRGTDEEDAVPLAGIAKGRPQDLLRQRVQWGARPHLHRFLI